MKVLAVQEDSIMPYKDTMKLRFLLVALVFVFHASLVFGFVFPDVGHTAVAVFFFMSGFGLETSLMSKKGYMASFLQKRVFGLMIQYWILMVFIAAAAAVFSLSMIGFVESIQTAFFTYPHWYVTELLMFYLLFFFSCMIPGGSRAARLVFLAVTSTLLMWLSADYYVTDLYYKSGICFVLGTLVAIAGDRLRTIPDRYIALLLLPLSAALILSYREAFGITDMVLSSVTSCMSCIVLILALKLDFRRWWFVPLAMIVVGALLTTTIDPTPTFNDSGAFMLLFDGICVVLCRISLLEEPLAFLGAMSLELYLVHYHTFWYVDPFVDGTVPTILCSAILSLILSYIAYRLCRAVMDFYNDGLVRMSAERT